MKKIDLIILSLTSLLIIISCGKKQEFDYPLVFTGDVINITDTSALFTAKISCLGEYPILESGFIWGVHSNDNNGIKLTNEENVTDIYSLKTNEELLPGKTYYVRAYFQTETVVSYGREVSFKSPIGEINTGNWTQLYNDNLDYGWCDFIRSSFTVNGTTYFAFESDGILYSYNQTSNTFSYELTNIILSTADYCAVYEGNAYIFSKNSFYLFNPQAKSFSKLSVLDENESKYFISGFIIDDNIYIGLGSFSISEYSKDFWKYNITTDSWQQITSFPGEYRSYGFSFSINNAGYIGGGYNLIQGQWPYPKFNDLWCYIPEIDKWIQKESLPFENEELFDLQGTNIEKFGYCFYKNKFYEYNPIFDIWEKMSDLNIKMNLCYPHIFTSDSRVFILEVKNYMDKKYFKMWAYEK